MANAGTSNHPSTVRLFPGPNAACLGRWMVDVGSSLRPQFPKSTGVTGEVPGLEIWNATDRLLDAPIAAARVMGP